MGLQSKLKLPWSVTYDIYDIYDIVTYVKVTIGTEMLIFIIAR